jgi:hypothetical protein
MENDVVDRLIDKHGDVQTAMLFVHKKIDSILTEFKLKNERSLDNESVDYWIDIYSELMERKKLEI